MKFLVMSALSKNPCTAHFLILGGLSIFGLQNGRKKDVSSFATIKAKNVVFVVRICMGSYATDVLVLCRQVKRDTTVMHLG